MLLRRVFVLAVLTASTALAEESIGGRDVAVWRPAASAPRPWPVVVFSHGFHGCARQSEFLMQALAGAGYAVYSINHADAACRDAAKWRESAAVPLGDPGHWTDATYRDRRDDVAAVLDALAADPRVDLTKVAIAGHSLGGYTALGVAGAWPSWKDARVKAVVALSPYCQPFVQKSSLKGLSVPVLYQGGTLDLGITPFVLRPGGAYDLTPPPRGLVVFEGAGHFAFTSLRQRYQEAIDAYAVAFLNSVLEGAPFPPALAAPHGDARTVKLELGR